MKISPTEEQELHFNDSSTIMNSDFDSSKPVKILIHGYTQSLISQDFPQKIKDGKKKRCK